MAKKSREDILDTVTSLLAIGNTVDPQTGIARPIPEEYIHYYICKHVYGCLPSQLADEDYATVMLHLEFYNIEQEFKPSMSLD